MESASGKADHLVVLIHGLWGNPGNLKYLSTSLRQKFSEDQLHILVAKSHADSYTYDGIETGGERVTQEVEAEIKKIEENGVELKKISMIGYSVGGLIARYAVGLMHQAKIFDRLEPVNFTTFATPHLGVRSPSLGTWTQIWNNIGGRTLSFSGRQIFLIDNFRNTGRPLLSVLADPNSVFIRALKLFQHRTLYANIINDRSVNYFTSAISATDPFADLSTVELNPIQDTEGVLLDPLHPVRRKPLGPPTPLLQRFTKSLKYHLESLPFYFFFTFLLPFGALFFLSSAAIQTFRSAQRLKQHEAGKAGIEVERYRRTPFILDEMRGVADRMVSRAAQGGGEDYLPTPPPEEAERVGLLDGGQSSSAETLVGKEKPTEKGGDEWPTLALTKEQFEMIESLDDVGFTKYRVYISSVRHTHAAIVVRIPWRPGFGQGKVVVKHWINEFIL